MNMLGFHASVTYSKLKSSIMIPFEKYDGKVNAFQIYLKNPHRYALSNISYEQIEQTKQYINENNITIVSHGCYLLNYATDEKWEQKVMNAIDDLLVIDSLGGIGSVFHVGKYLKQDIDYSLENMNKFITQVIEKSEKLGCKSHFILETAAGQGTECLVNLIEFGEFYSKLDAKIKERVSICIDTCHVFAAGYDLRTIEKTREFIKLIEDNIGWNHVKLIHLNDSDRDISSKIDRHANLLKGFITNVDESGLKTFVKFCYDMKIPIILETPDTDDNRENDIKILNNWIK